MEAFLRIVVVVFNVIISILSWCFEHWEFFCIAIFLYLLFKIADWLNTIMGDVRILRLHLYGGTSEELGKYRESEITGLFGILNLKNYPEDLTKQAIDKYNDTSSFEEINKMIDWIVTEMKLYDKNMSEFNKNKAD